MDKPVKVIYNNTTRRFIVSSSISWDDFENKLRTLFSIASSQPIHLFYRDEDGDVITLSTDVELVDLLSTHRGPLRLLLSTTPSTEGLDTVAWVFESSISPPSDHTIQDDATSIHSEPVLVSPKTTLVDESEPLIQIEEETIEMERTATPDEMDILSSSQDKGKGRAEEPQQQEEPEKQPEQDQPYSGLMAEFEALLQQFRDVLDANPQLSNSVSAIIDQIRHQIPISLEAFAQWLQSFRVQVHGTQSPSSSEPTTARSRPASFYMATPYFTVSAGNPPPPYSTSTSNNNNNNNAPSAPDFEKNTTNAITSSGPVPGAYPEPQQQPPTVSPAPSPNWFSFPTPFGNSFKFPPPTTPFMHPVPPKHPMYPRPPMPPTSVPFGYSRPRHAYHHAHHHFGPRFQFTSTGSGHEMEQQETWRTRQDEISARKKSLVTRMKTGAISREEMRKEAKRVVKDAKRLAKEEHGEAWKETKRFGKEIKKEMKEQVKAWKKQMGGKWSSDESSDDSDVEGNGFFEMSETERVKRPEPNSREEDRSAFAPPPTVSEAQDREREVEALATLNSMGFTMDHALREKLRRNGGNVQAVIDELLGV